MCNLCKLTEKRNQEQQQKQQNPKVISFWATQKRKLCAVNDRDGWWKKEIRAHSFVQKSQSSFFQMPNDVYQRYNESNHTKLISKFRCSSKMQETVKWLLTNAAFSLSLPLPLPFPLSIWNKNAIFVWKLKESCLNKCSIQKKWKRNRDETRRHETRWVSDIWNKRTQNNQHNKISSIDWMGMPRYRINWNVNIFRNKSRRIVFLFIYFVLLKLLAIVTREVRSREWEWVMRSHAQNNEESFEFFVLLQFSTIQ